MTQRVNNSREAYTLIEIMVTIAIMGLIIGIVTFSYSFGKGFNTLKSENDRLASVLRNVRVRDFSGAVAYNGTKYVYPSGGYGIHIDNNYKTCSGNSKLSCVIDGDCGSFGTCSVSSAQSNYIIFADFTNPDGGSFYDGGKAGNEYLDEFKIPKELSIKFLGGTSVSKADIMFKNNVVTAYESTDWATALTATEYVLNIENIGGCSASGGKKGEVKVNTVSKNIYDQLLSC